MRFLRKPVGTVNCCTFSGAPGAGHEGRAAGAASDADCACAASTPPRTTIQLSTSVRTVDMAIPTPGGAPAFPHSHIPGTGHEAPRPERPPGRTTWAQLVHLSYQLGDTSPAEGLDAGNGFGHHEFDFDNRYQIVGEVVMPAAAVVSLESSR